VSAMDDPAGTALRVDRVARSGWQGWLAASSVTLVLSGLVILDLVDRSVREWFSERDFTTSALSGILVLLVTVLVVDRVISGRQLRDRSQVIAAQAALVTSQAARTSTAVTAALDGNGDRDAAADENRTYMTMLLISAPVLIDARLTRTFLEEAQWLAAEFARALAMTEDHEPSDALKARLDDAVERLRAASRPLLQILNVEQWLALDNDDAKPAAEM
jgi:hypothetical protein